MPGYVYLVPLTTYASSNIGWRDIEVWVIWRSRSLKMAQSIDHVRLTIIAIFVAFSSYLTLKTL